MTTGTDGGDPAPMRLVRVGLHSQGEPIALMRTDCHVCRSEGLHARARVEIASGERRVTARLLQVEAGLLNPHEIGLSEDAWMRLGAVEVAVATVRPAPPAASMSLVRHKLYGGALAQKDFTAILGDVQAGLLSDVQLATFLSAGAALPLDDEETTALTRAMVVVGDRLSWDAPRVMDKHCVGGLPGNRTTPIVVAIAAACGLVIPKTSSRAITSPAGTADTMETLAPVDLDLPAIRRVVEAEGGCIVWGGAVRPTTPSCGSSARSTSTPKVSLSPLSCRRRSPPDQPMSSSTFPSARPPKCGPPRRRVGSRPGCRWWAQGWA